MTKTQTAIMKRVEEKGSFGACIVIKGKAVIGSREMSAARQLVAMGLLVQTSSHSSADYSKGKTVRYFEASFRKAN